MLKSQLIVFFCLLFYLFTTINCGRIDKNKNREKSKIEELLSLIKSRLITRNIDFLQKYHFQNTELLTLAEELNKLHLETVPLIFLLLDDSSSCKEYVTNIEKNIVDKSKNITININLNDNITQVDIKKSLETIQKLEIIAKNIFKISIELLTLANKAFDETLDTLVQSKNVFDDAKKLTIDELNDYIKKLETNLNNIDQKVKNSIKINNDYAVSNRQNQLQIRTNVSELDFTHVTQVQCSVVQIYDNNNEAVAFLNSNDIDDIFKQLRSVESTISKLLTKSSDDVIFVDEKKKLNTLKERAKKLIDTIKYFYTQRNEKQQELIKQIENALKAKDSKEISEVELELLLEINNARTTIEKLWKKTSNYSEIMIVAKRIQHFPVTVAAIERGVALWYLSQKFSDIKDSFDAVFLKQIKDVTISRLQLAMNKDGVFGDEVGKYTYDLTNHLMRYGQEAVLQRLDELMHQKFSLSTDRYWLADVMLFLDSNLQIIFRTSCDSSFLYTIWPIDRNLLLRKLLSFITVVRVQKYNDIEIWERTSKLKYLTLNFRNLFEWYKNDRNSGDKGSNINDPMETFKRTLISQKRVNLFCQYNKDNVFKQNNSDINL